MYDKRIAGQNLSVDQTQRFDQDGTPVTALMDLALYERFRRLRVSLAALIDKLG